MLRSTLLPIRLLCLRAIRRRHARFYFSPRLRAAMPQFYYFTPRDARHDAAVLLPRDTPRFDAARMLMLRLRHAFAFSPLMPLIRLFRYAR